MGLHTGARRSCLRCRKGLCPSLRGTQCKKVVPTTLPLGSGYAPGCLVRCGRSGSIVRGWGTATLCRCVQSHWGVMLEEMNRPLRMNRPTRMAGRLIWRRRGLGLWRLTSSREGWGKDCFFWSDDRPSTGEESRIAVVPSSSSSKGIYRSKRMEKGRSCRSQSRLSCRRCQ